MTFDETIHVIGTRTHNLRNLTVDIPKRQLAVLTGVSGSGKSSLAFSTIAAEAQRLVAESYPVFVRTRLPQHEPADVDRIDGLTFTTTIDQRQLGGGRRSTLGTASDIAPMLRMLFSRAGTPSAGYSPAYSFNDPTGMCPRCEGLGTVSEIDLDRLLDPSRSLREGAVQFPTFTPGTYRWKRLMTSGLADTEVPFGRLPAGVRQILLYAEGLKLGDPQPGYPGHGIFDGIVPRFRKSYLRRTPSHLTVAERRALEHVVTERACPECAGTRVNVAARRSLIQGRSIADWASMPVAALAELVTDIDLPKAAPLLRAIAEQLDALVAIGLGYLTLERGASTLSGGEAQRVKIVRHLGSALSDVTYVLDEPSAGLHPHDVMRLLELLRRLRDAHNTVLVVSHHPQIIEAADHVIDLGPGAGDQGGRILFAGEPDNLPGRSSPTGRMLRDRPTPKPAPRHARGVATVHHARVHNLQDLTVDVPRGVLTAVTGVAGSGKSSLATVALPTQHPEFVVVSQRPLHGGTRSNPATVLGVAEPVRRHFARATGRPAGEFTANGAGACQVCRGKGVVTTDLAFLDDVRIPCEACGGTRFRQETLVATIDGRSIADVLDMGPREAADMFMDDPEITGSLSWMNRTGLQHLPLGRGLDTLSGGERQRLLLARELATSADRAALSLVLDEPTVGLHAQDVDELLGLLDELVDAGATVVAVEHDQRTIAHADHVIDLGPGAGRDGGRIVHEGTPNSLMEATGSITGTYLRRIVEGGHD
jgi:excinuclease UvrABC ATPase subunit